MTTAVSSPERVSPVQRGNCCKCHRAPGRPRSPQTAGDGLLPVNQLVVCDRCWHAAGGEDAVVTTIDEDGHLTVDLEGSAEFEALVAAVEEYDARHPIDRLLIEAGIRWETLRWIAVPARCDLVRYVLERVPPRYSRLALSPDAWMEAVAAHIEQQTGPGQEFRYNPKRRRWWRIANVLRCCSDWQGRPLTWVSQEEIAAAVGCSTRTVRRCVAWLQREGLLHEVLPGLEKLARQVVPDDETAAEQAEREARAEAAEAAEDAAVARARAELDAVRGGLFGDQAAEAAADVLSPEHAAALAAVEELDQGWVQLVPVYELRTPMSAAERAEEAAITRAHTKLADSPGDALARHYMDELVPVANAGVYRELFAIGHDGQLTRLTSTDAANAVTCGNAVGLLRPDQFGHPPKVILSDLLESSGVQPVDNRPASPGSDKERVRPSQNGSDSAVSGRTRSSEGDRPKAQQSEAVRAAEWLLRSRLHPVLCDDVSVRWLASLIRGSRLLSEWLWTWDDLADLIHGVPEYPHLPYDIRNSPGWIKARFKRAIPQLPPAALRQRLGEPDTDRVLLLEHARLVGAPERILTLIASDDETSQHHRDEAERARLADGVAKRAAIDDCPLCDEHGWLTTDPTDPTAPDARCNHDLSTGGW